MTKDDTQLCIAAGYDVRTLKPFDVYELAGRIARDRVLQERADRYRVPASQGARDRVGEVLRTPHHERVAHFASNEAASNQFAKDCDELMASHAPNYEKALAAMSTAERAALRARVGS